LAPAGDFEALKAAVANGADAVYFGLDEFNARHRAANFALASLHETVDYLHKHGVRGYVTFNTLVFPEELPQAAEYLRVVIEAGADALIVQDLGLVRLIKEMCPSFPVHGSTQMTLSCALGVEFVRRLGVERVILARELSTREIKRIASETSMPLEVFVHGALCVAYSGQCLTSEALGGRSANRGQCAQACRQPYDLIVDGRAIDLGDKKYLLSPGDLAAWDLVDKLIGLGIASLKIEGRLKSAHYVAAATHTYRRALDAAQQGQPFALKPQEQLDLAQSFSRGFTHGFLNGVNHQCLVEGRFPKARGVKVGEVVDVTARGLVVALDALHCCLGVDGQPGRWTVPVKPGDGVVIDEGRPEQDEQGGRLYAVREVSSVPGAAIAAQSGAAARRGQRHALAYRGKLIELLFGRADVCLAAVSRGALVWKTDDPALKKRLARTYAAPASARRVTLDFAVSLDASSRLVVTATAATGSRVTVCTAESLPPARKHPTTKALVAEQLGRLGGSPYILGSVTLFAAEGAVGVLPVMAPKSVLNRLRRDVVAQLESQSRGRGAQYRVDPMALERLRARIAGGGTLPPGTLPPGTLPPGTLPPGTLPPGTLPPGTLPPRLAVLCRSTEQLRGVLEWSPKAGCAAPDLVYLDFEEVRRSKEGVRQCRAAGIAVAVATPRVIKPFEEGLLLQVGRCQPDAVLARNLAAINFFTERFPGLPLVGDSSLNVANELTAGLLISAGLVSVVPGCDLNFAQLSQLVQRSRPEWFEVLLHQHVPMFHMEHCVFSHLLSNGRDFHDCGRPCDRHRVELRDHVKEAHPLLADVGCRNTVFNAHAQSAAPYVARLCNLGVRKFRVELLRESASEAVRLLERYAAVLAGRETGLEAWRGLRVLNQVGLTRGAYEYE
jgi:putative protease